ncbi:hypothetical protein MPSEU_001078100 [Mayamaea pseudoterrestris]|nr:hypothetical protein MPSEU_001078100 [Mayamaea pseudoterrestris]
MRPTPWTSSGFGRSNRHRERRDSTSTGVTESAAVLSVSPRHSNQHSSSSGSSSNRQKPFARHSMSPRKQRPPTVTNSHASSNQSISSDKIMMRRGRFLESSANHDDEEKHSGGGCDSTSASSNKWRMHPATTSIMTATGGLQAESGSYSGSKEQGAFGSSSSKDFGVSNNTFKYATNHSANVENDDDWGQRMGAWDEDHLSPHPWSDTGFAGEHVDDDMDAIRFVDSSPRADYQFTKNEDNDVDLVSHEQGTLERPIAVEELDLDAREKEIKERQSMQMKHRVASLTQDESEQQLEELVVAPSASSHHGSKSLGKGILRFFGGRGRTSKSKGNSSGSIKQSLLPGVLHASSSMNSTDNVSVSLAPTGIVTPRSNYALTGSRKFAARLPSYQQRHTSSTPSGQVTTVAAMNESTAIDAQTSGDTSVSEVTNPTVFTHVQPQQQAIDPFSDSYFFAEDSQPKDGGSDSTMNESGSSVHPPNDQERDEEEYRLAPVASDEFSDPFFPSSSPRQQKDSSGLSQQTDRAAVMASKSATSKNLAALSNITVAMERSAGPDSVQCSFSENEEKKEQDHLPLPTKRIMSRASLLGSSRSFRGLAKSPRQSVSSYMPSVHSKQSVTTTEAVKSPIKASSHGKSGLYSQPHRLIFSAAPSPRWTGRELTAELSSPTTSSEDSTREVVHKPSFTTHGAIVGTKSAETVSRMRPRTVRAFRSYSPSIPAVEKTHGPPLQGAVGSKNAYHGRVTPGMTDKLRKRQQRKHEEQTLSPDVTGKPSLPRVATLSQPRTLAANKDSPGKVLPSSPRIPPNLSMTGRGPGSKTISAVSRIHPPSPTSSATKRSDAANFQGRLQRLRSFSPTVIGEQSNAVKSSPAVITTRPDPPIIHGLKMKPKADAPAHSYTLPTVASRKKTRDAALSTTSRSPRSNKILPGVSNSPTNKDDIVRNNAFSMTGSTASGLSRRPYNLATSTGAVVNRLQSSSSCSTDEGSTTLSLASMGTDINKLRTIIRKSRSKPIPERALMLDESTSFYSSCDESNIKDPVHRAGLRFLSKAIVPIQSAVRRHLALREALTRMWAIVIIQALARRVLAQKQYFHTVVTTIMIQAWWRGCQVRDRLLLKQCCAIEIQRFVRGYLATMSVYEDIFRVTIVQSVARRKVAIERATDRMIFIIHSQSLARGFLQRLRMKRMISAATVLQTKWRAFFCQFNYQLDVLDIIIVQSAWRRRSATVKVRDLQRVRRVNAAIKIQSKVRAGVCRSNFVILRAIVKIQSTWRMWACFNTYQDYRAAVKIQSVWRGFVCARTYLEYIAAVVIQAKVRMFLSTKRYTAYIAARLIQSNIRARLCRVTFVEYLSARKIQARIRCYSASSWYIGYINARRIQTQVRRYIALKSYTEYSAAVVIQSNLRCFLCSKRYIEYIAATMIQSQFRRHQCASAYIDYCSARKIQAAYRRSVCRCIYVEYVAARRLQTAYRRRSCRNAFVRYVAARKIQASFRRYVCSKSYVEYLAATIIQATFRCSIQRAKCKRYIAARKIQASYRRHVCLSSYVRHIAASAIQAIVRRYICLSAYHEYIAARKIQSQFRRYICYQPYVEYIGASRLQAAARGYLCREQYIKYLAARRIQAAFRGYARYHTYIEYVAARTIQCGLRKHICMQVYLAMKSAKVIQTAFRRHVCYQAFTNFMAARCIQTRARGYLCRVAYVDYIAAKIIQTTYRRHVCYRAYSDYMAAKCIQTRVRGYLCRSAYIDYIAAKVIQTSYRRHVCHHAYSNYIAARCIQTQVRGYLRRSAYINYVAAKLIQSIYRRHVCYQMYSNYMAALCIQTQIRGYLCRSAYDDYIAARYIQAQFRRHLCRSAYTEYISARKIQSLIRKLHSRRRFTRKVLEIRSAIVAQTTWRKYVNVKAYRQIIAVIRIQSQFRSYVVRRKKERLDSSLKIQCKWRTFVCRRSYFELRSVVRIQSYWRMFACSKHYLEYIAAMIVQTQWRAFAAHKRYKQERGATKIQAHWRAFVCSREYLLRVAATMIQAQFRMQRHRKVYKRYRSATSIQAAWRSYDCAMEYLRVVADLLIVQSVARRWLATRRVQAVKNKSALKIQKAVKGYLARVYLQSRREELNAAVNIQRAWRGFVVYTEYCFTIAYVVVCQSVVRRMLAVKSCAKMQIVRKRHAVRVIQTFARQQLAKRIRASVQIQCFWRGFLGQAQYLIAKCECDAATTIQSHWRRFWCYSNFVISIHSSILIQSTFRMHKELTEYDVKLEAIAAIQDCFRCYLAQKNSHQQSLVRCIIQAADPIEARERQSAVQIQKVLRGSKARASVDKHLAARDIQSAWRRAFARAYFIDYISARRIQAFWRCKFLSIPYKRRRAAVQIQCFWRQRSARRYFVALREVCLVDEIKAAVFLQKVWRGIAVRLDEGKFVTWQRRLYVEEPAAVEIQKVWRGFNAMLLYWHTLGSAIQVQSTVRSWITRVRLSRERHSVLLQRVTRGYIARMSVAKIRSHLEAIELQHLAATLIQSSWRGYTARVTFEDLIVCEDSATLIQASFRAYKARLAMIQLLMILRLQSVARRWLACSRSAEKLGAIIYLQCIARGMLARKQATERRAIMQLEKIGAASSSPSLKILNSLHSSLLSPRLGSLRCDRNPVATLQQDIELDETVAIKEKAARRIQRFFLMVKAEVDQEIRRALEKKRRKKRKIHKKKLRDRDDEILENIWSMTMDENAGGFDFEVANFAAMSKTRPMQERNRPGSSLRNMPSMSGGFVSTTTDAESSHKSGPIWEQWSCTAPLRAASPAFSVEMKFPPSRLATLSRAEFDDDLFLEEAWIDTEVRQAKERRLINKAKKSHRTQIPDGAGPPSSRASNHERPSSRTSYKPERPPSQSSHQRMMV